MDTDNSNLPKLFTSAGWEPERSTGTVAKDGECRVLLNVKIKPIRIYIMFWQYTGCTER